MKKKNKIKRNIFIVTVILIVIVFFSVIFALINSISKKIITGTFINNINVSGLTVDDAKEKLENIMEHMKNKEIILIHEQDEIPMKISELNLDYNIENSVEKAYLLGKDNNIFINNFTIIKTMLKNENIDMNLRYDENLLNEKIESINSMLPGIVQEPSYYIEDENLIITKGQAGIKINSEELKSKIIAEIYNLNAENVRIEIPIYEKDPDAIDIDKIYSEIYKEPENAYVSENPAMVHPNINGVDFAISIEEAKEMLKNDQEEYTIPLKYTVADITVTDLGEEAFPNILGDFSTLYDPSNKNRSNNIALASEKINGTVIMPGETFSYNQIVGKRTIEAGYKEAGAYAGGEVVQEVGGGICQVSSTLYNAVLYANLEIVERSNHYFETSYVDPGRDATVSWGTVDFKFKNNRTYPIKVEAEARDGMCEITIKGISEKGDYEVILQSKVTSIVKRDTEYTEDKSLEDGVEIVEQEGHDGCTSETYKTLKQNGTIVSTELISSDYYHALNKKITKGTKKEALNTMGIETQQSEGTDA